MPGTTSKFTPIVMRSSVCWLLVDDTAILGLLRLHAVMLVLDINIVRRVRLLRCARLQRQGLLLVPTLKAAQSVTLSLLLQFLSLPRRHCLQGHHRDGSNEVSQQKNEGLR